MIKAFLASLALAVPAFARIVLVQLGFGIFTFASVTATINFLTDLLKQHYSSMPIDLLMLLNLAGFGEFMGLISAAIVARLSLQFLPKLGIIPQS